MFTEVTKPQYSKSYQIPECLSLATKELEKSQIKTLIIPCQNLPQDFF